MTRPFGGRSTVAVLSALALSGAALATPFVSAGSSSVASPPPFPRHVTKVVPVPASAGHIATQTLAFPPTTEFCEQALGIACYDPNQFEEAYHTKALWRQGIDGRGQTIAIVDSFGSPTIQHDLDVFSDQYNLPHTQVTVVQPSGAVPPFDPTNSDMTGWAGETTLDVEWAHAMAPGARIVLVETPVAETEGVTGLPEMMNAEKWVIDHRMADVITMSFGATEDTFPDAQSLMNLRYAFKFAQKHHVTLLAASGDAGATDYDINQNLYDHRVNSWPSSDPLVTSLGGTQLHLDATGKRIAPDEAWNDGYGATGGGLSIFFSRPSFQNSVRSIVGDQRGTPDISMSAAVDGAAVFYYSYDPNRVGWHLVGGTSEASPLFSGIVAMADQLAHHRLGNINPALYRLRGEHSGIVDVTKGDNSFAGVTGFPALPGYDLSTGLGTINAAVFVPALVRAWEDAH